MTDRTDALDRPMPPVIYAMTGAAGLAAANLHYSQPLLPTIAASFSIAPATIGLLPALTQAGFALGILLILPLADLLERRTLVTTLLVLVAGFLMLHAVAPTPEILLFAGFMVGLTGVVPQLLTPFASLLAPSGRAGAAVGLVLSGVLTGVLLSKVLAGLMTESAGWRELYGLASGLMILLALILWRVLPKSRADNRIGYGALLASTFALAGREAKLRRHALNGALTFAAFMTFWATYAVYLSDDYGYGPGIAGLFGIAGFVGAMAASFAGRAVDRGNYRRTLLIAGLLMVAGFALLVLSGASLGFMITGLLLLDAGAGLSHAANQTSAFSIDLSARGRINSVYMFGYFAGGAAGTLLATLCLSAFGWTAVCALGALFSLAIVGLECVSPKDRL